MKKGGKYIKAIRNFESIYLKMDEKIIKFGDTEIEKQKFPQHKSPVSIII